MMLFSYGSNNPVQLAARLGRPIRGTPAYLPGYKRIFRGWGRRWGGGVASLEPQKDSIVYGYVEEVTEADLIALDRYEGVGIGFYRRQLLTVNIVTPKNELQREVIAYICNETDENPPSRRYLDAIAATENSFWTPGRNPKFAKIESCNIGLTPMNESEN